jgi:hypothetical protein
MSLFFYNDASFYAKDIFVIVFMPSKALKQEHYQNWAQAQLSPGLGPYSNNALVLKLYPTCKDL